MTKRKSPRTAKRRTKRDPYAFHNAPASSMTKHEFFTALAMHANIAAGNHEVDLLVFAEICTTTAEAVLDSLQVNPFDAPNLMAQDKDDDDDDDDDE